MQRMVAVLCMHYNVENETVTCIVVNTLGSCLTDFATSFNVTCCTTELRNDYCIIELSLSFDCWAVRIIVLLDS